MRRARTSCVWMTRRWKAPEGGSGSCVGDVRSEVGEEGEGVGGGCAMPGIGDDERVLK